MLSESVIPYEDTSSWWKALAGRACQEATSRALQHGNHNGLAWAAKHACGATAGSFCSYPHVMMQKGEMDEYTQGLRFLMEAYTKGRKL